MARYLITGGSGFIGQYLCRRWLALGHELWVFTRYPDRLARRFPDESRTRLLISFSDWGELDVQLAFTGIINLAGEGVADRRWSARRKRCLVESRVQTTRDLVVAMKRMRHRPPVLISGSAIGYYGHQDEVDVEESRSPVKGFSWSLCERWEQMAFQAANDETRVCVMRLGVVLGTSGGFFQRVRWLYTLGLGGPLGDGQHWFSWIHIDDVVGVIEFLLSHKNLSGAFNVVSPQPVRQIFFSEQLAAAYGKKDPLRNPEWFLRLIFGELAELLLSSQRAFPERLRGAGYKFLFQALTVALYDLIPEAKLRLKSTVKQTQS